MAKKKIGEITISRKDGKDITKADIDKATKQAAKIAKVEVLKALKKAGFNVK